MVRIIVHKQVQPQIFMCSPSLYQECTQNLTHLRHSKSILHILFSLVEKHPIYNLSHKNWQYNEQQTTASNTFTLDNPHRFAISHKQETQEESPLYICSNHVTW